MARIRDLSHPDAMRSHAMRRLFQRHGMTITNADFAAINAAIAGGSSPALGPARYGGTLHAVELRGRTVYAVWNEIECCVATFLPAGIPFEVKYPGITKAISS